ncbi:hypothetical protein [Pseudomonas sp. P108]|uniref:hypothetical protein n=1 Tax=Pseudomonas sp. P108 TaxID=1837993 RepID=UPI0029341949|nr:hypothetical protein [Pseudomonas sp. P108]WNZ85166.1 hypothetical protein QOM10_04255 [Pseudomonas sp. P108]
MNQNSNIYEIKLEDASVTDFEAIATANSPELYKILSPKGKTAIQIGAIAYLVRMRTDWIYSVEKHSFRPSRRNVISKIVIGSLQSIAQKNLSEVTVRNQIKNGIAFVDWADFNGYKDIFEDIQNARHAFHNYILELRDELLYAGLNSQTALHKQGGALAILTWWYEHKISKVKSGISPIRFNNDTNHTEIPDEDEVNQALHLADNLFHNITDFLLDKLPFPYLLHLPNESAWALPCTCWIMPKWKLAKREEMVNGNWMWDYANGQLNSLDYIAKKFDYPPSGARSNRKRSELALERANLDPRHPARLRIAYWAVNSFQLKMFAITGINPADLVKQVWEPKMEDNPVITRQHFRSFKTRAGHLVDFEIHIKFLKEFQKYCRLRNFLADGRDTNLLFFRDTGSKLIPIDPNFLYTYFDLAKKQFDPHLKPVNARQWRVFKADWVANHFGVTAAAEQLQNRVETVEKSYTNGSEFQQNLEFSNFFDELESHIQNYETTGTLKIPGGNCNGTPGAHSKFNHLSRIEPDCKNMVGCLFCKNFAVNPDSEGVRKLLSMQYFINELEQATSSDAHFDNLFGESKSALKHLIKTIELISEDKKNLVNQIQGEVFDGQLTNYWSAKLSLFIDLGFIQ